MADSFGFGFDDEQKENRIVGNDINLRTNDPEDMMLEIMELLNDTVTPIPEVGKFYTFVYNAKTPGETYDQHPLIACTALEQWGFKDSTFTGKNPGTIPGMNWQVNYILYSGMNLMTLWPYLMQNSS